MGPSVGWGPWGSGRAQDQARVWKRGGPLQLPIQKDGERGSPTTQGHSGEKGASPGLPGWGAPLAPNLKPTQQMEGDSQSLLDSSLACQQGAQLWGLPDPHTHPTLVPQVLQVSAGAWRAQLMVKPSSQECGSLCGAPQTPASA